MEKIRKGDEVVVIAGKDKGRRGTVLLRVDLEHVVVEGVNRAKKHVKPNPVKGDVYKRQIHCQFATFRWAQRFTASRWSLEKAPNWLVPPALRRSCWRVKGCMPKCVCVPEKSAGSTSNVVPRSVK